MINAITTKIELDVFSASDVIRACQLAVKHKIPCLVVHPELVEQVQFERIKCGGDFKIIAPVDWPKGDVRGSLKLRGVNKASLSSDGFEILLSHGISVNESKSEVKALLGFVEQYVSRFFDVRFVLKSINEDSSFVNVCSAIADVGSSVIVRSDCRIKAQSSKANFKAHSGIVKKISSVCPYRIKLSGNVDLKLIEQCISNNLSIYRFAMSVQQFDSFISSIQSQDNKLVINR